MQYTIYLFSAQFKNLYDGIVNMSDFQVLGTDRAFSEVQLNDSMVPEEGIKALCHGLAANQACKVLQLKVSAGCFCDKNWLDNISL